MIHTIRITAHYFENYNTDGGAPFWKSKGEVEFNVKADADLIMYNKDEAEQVMKDMLAAQSHEMAKYEFNSFEMIFHEPTQLDANEFQKRLLNIAGQLLNKHIDPLAIKAGEKCIHVYEDEVQVFETPGVCVEVLPHEWDEEPQIMFLADGEKNPIQVFMNTCKQ
jgi:hypothetical protein